MDKYYLAVNGAQQGPFTLEELKTKEINSKTLVWTQRLGNWTEARYIDELKTIVEQAPPPIPTEPQSAQAGNNYSNKIDFSDSPRMFKNPFSFEGRIRRTEFGISFLILCIFNSVFLIITDNGTQENSGYAVLMFFLAIPTLWFALAQGAKRCHDVGHNGWWQLIPFYNLWLLFEDSQDGVNEYGENPKGIGNYGDNI